MISPRSVAGCGRAEWALPGFPIVAATGLLAACGGLLGPEGHDVPAYVSPRHMVVVPVEVGGVDGHFLLDTGAEDSEVTTSFAAQLEPAGKTLDLYAPATREQPVEIPTVWAGGIRFAAGEVRYPELLGVVELEPLGRYLAHDVDGILGWDVLREYVVGLDLVRRRVIAGRSLTVEQALSNLGMAATSTRIELQIVGDRPVVAARAEGRPLRLLLDTGSDSTTISETAWMRLGLQVPSGAPAVDRWTVTGTVQSRLARLETLEIGPLRLSDVPVLVRMGGPGARLPARRSTARWAWTCWPGTASSSTDGGRRCCWTRLADAPRPSGRLEQDGVALRYSRGVIGRADG